MASFFRWVENCGVNMYFDGIAVTQSKKKARSYFTEAAKKGNEKAKDYLFGMDIMETE